MKIKRDQEKFNPVTIVIENEEELSVLAALFNVSEVQDVFANTKYENASLDFRRLLDHSLYWEDAYLCLMGMFEK